MKMNIRIARVNILLIMTALLMQRESFAQFRIQPDWVKNPPHGYINYYFVGQSQSCDYRLAVQQAMADAALRLRNYYDWESYTLIDQTPVADYSRLMAVFHGHKMTILLKVVDTYVQEGLDGDCKTYVLVSTPRPPSDVRQIPDDMGALLRSTLIPGWGQSYKDYKERGMIFLVSEGIAVGVAAMLYHKAISGSDPRARSNFNLALGIAIGIHILNVIDSVTITPNIQYE